MTRIDFYVFEGEMTAHDRVICRVIEKAWHHGHRVYLNCDAPDLARRFDDMLWQFRDTSFVPHGLSEAVGETGDADVPVLIGMNADTVAEPDVLANLAAEVPATVSRFARVIESAGYDDQTRQAARSRYRYYQERGFPLHTHKLGR